MQQTTSRQTVTIILILMAISLVGIVLGFLYARLPSNNPQKSQEGCESVGGDWNTVTGECLVSYKEAGESCTDGGQCKSGVCSPTELSTNQRVELEQGPVSGVVGVCASSTEFTGCVPQVLKGTISKESMCEK